MELYDVTPDEVTVGIAVEMPAHGRPYISLPTLSTDERSERHELRFSLTDGLIASSNCFSCGRLLDAVLTNENGQLHLERDKSDTEAVLIRLKYGERLSNDTPSLNLETAGQAHLLLETSWTEEHFDKHPEDCQPYFTLHKGALLKLMPETTVLLSRTRATHKYKHFWHWFIPGIKPIITTVNEPIGSIYFDGARVFWRQK